MRSTRTISSAASACVRTEARRFFSGGENTLVVIPSSKPVSVALAGRRWYMGEVTRRWGEQKARASPRPSGTAATSVQGRGGRVHNQETVEQDRQGGPQHTLQVVLWCGSEHARGWAIQMLDTA